MIRYNTAEAALVQAFRMIAASRGKQMDVRAGKRYRTGGKRRQKGGGLAE